MEKLISFLDPVLLNSQRSGFVRCWHAKTDGSAASVFHDNCDGKGPTVTIIKSGSYIFGAYTDVSWHSSKYQIVIFFPRGWYSRKNSVGCATRFTKSIPSYNQNQRLSLPYLGPDQKSDIPLKTRPLNQYEICLIISSLAQSKVKPGNVCMLLVVG